jgi:DNA mismatch endonuclease (patch repair protein)
MVDVVSPESRSRMMSGIRGKDTKPEMIVRKALFAAGYRFRLHRRDLPGAPDVVMPGRKVAIFVHGCFWHMHAKCKYAKLPSTRPEFWQSKLSGNLKRDQKAIDALMSSGWRVLTVWECSTRNAAALASLREILSRWIESGEISGEISGPKSN